MQNSTESHYPTEEIVEDYGLPIRHLYIHEFNCYFMPAECGSWIEIVREYVGRTYALQLVYMSWSASTNHIKSVTSERENVNHLIDQQHSYLDFAYQVVYILINKPIEHKLGNFSWTRRDSTRSNDLLNAVSITDFATELLQTVISVMGRRCGLNVLRAWFAGAPSLTKLALGDLTES
jgi:hypothetical protein